MRRWVPLWLSSWNMIGAAWVDWCQVDIGVVEKCWDKFLDVGLGIRLRRLVVFWRVDLGTTTSWGPEIKIGKEWYSLKSFSEALNHMSDGQISRERSFHLREYCGDQLWRILCEMDGTLLRYYSKWLLADVRAKAILNFKCWDDLPSPTLGECSRY